MLVTVLGIREWLLQLQQANYIIASELSILVKVVTLKVVSMLICDYKLFPSCTILLVNVFWD